MSSLSALIFFIFVVTFPRSFTEVKFVLLVFFFLFNSATVCASSKIIVKKRLFKFYFFLGLAGCLWSIIGVINEGYIEGIVDSFRLYVIWSIVFIVIFDFLRINGDIRIIHKAIAVSGVMIAIVNFVGLYDQAAGIGIISESLRKELDLFIGFREGYVQITSHNIGSLFIVIPYLLTLELRSDAREYSSTLTRISLALCVAVAVLSGRRALWLSILMVPAIIIFYSYFTSSFRLIKRNVRKLLVLYFVGCIVASSAPFLMSINAVDIKVLQHISSAFSSEDERMIQKGFLFDAFTKHPVVGAGFGAYGGYTRSLDRPWIYELTYHQMLFNFGLLGVLYHLLLFALFFYYVTRIIRRKTEGSAIPFAMMVSLVTLLIGAYSNPYLGSFDFLIYIGLLPYLATFSNGFDSGETKVQESLNYSKHMM